MVGKFSDSQLDEIYNIGYRYLFSTFIFLESSFADFLLKLDVGDFKLASISGITGSQIHCISPGRLLADRSR